MINCRPLRQLMINDNGFAFDPQDGHTYTISPVGLEVIRWLKAGHTEDEIVQLLADQYEVKPRLARRDCQRFVETLHTLGLLQLEESL